MIQPCHSDGIPDSAPESEVSGSITGISMGYFSQLLINFNNAFQEGFCCNVLYDNSREFTPSELFYDNNNILIKCINNNKHFSVNIADILEIHGYHDRLVPQIVTNYFQLFFKKGSPFHYHDRSFAIEYKNPMDTSRSHMILFIVPPIIYDTPPFGLLKIHRCEHGPAVLPISMFPEPSKDSLILAIKAKCLTYYEELNDENDVDIPLPNFITTMRTNFRSSLAASGIEISMMNPESNIGVNTRSNISARDQHNFPYETYLCNIPHTPVDEDSPWETPVASRKNTPPPSIHVIKY